MLSVTYQPYMLTVIMKNVIMLNIVAQGVPYFASGHSFLSQLDAVMVPLLQYSPGCHYTQQNDAQHTSIQHNNTQHNDIQHNDIQHNNKKCDTEHKDTKHINRALFC